VKPIPIQVIHTLAIQAYRPASINPTLRCIADMCIIGFFFLCRPGEHTVNSSNTPFKMQDVKFYIGARLLDIQSATNAELNASTRVSLTFTTQKNGVKGEVISHGRSGHALTCPVLALARRLQYHRSAQYPLNTPIGTFDVGDTTYSVTSKQIRLALQGAILLSDQSTLDIKPEEVQTRALRAGGATALLCANVDPNTIQLLGRWKSDAMLRYLHVRYHPDNHTLARSMFNEGSLRVTPGLQTPQDDLGDT